MYNATSHGINGISCGCELLARTTYVVCIKVSMVVKFNNWADEEITAYSMHATMHVYKVNTWVLESYFVNREVLVTCDFTDWSNATEHLSLLPR